MNNNTLLNGTTSTYVGCSINFETVYIAWFATSLITSLTSLVGNIMLIVVVYRTRRITSTDYFVVNMAVSDVFFPILNFFYIVFLFCKFADRISHTTGTVLCKFLNFFLNVSYQVSILSLIVIAFYRFYAVAFPMRARVQSRRTCIILLFLTWALPIAMCSPTLFFLNFNLKYQFCYLGLSLHHWRIWNIIRISFFFFVPVIIFKLRRQKIPGNAKPSQAVIRRKKQNFRLTAMFITITVAFMLCWGMERVMYLNVLFLLVINWCTFLKVITVVVIFPTVFYAINPLIYFIFCPSYRQGIKQLLSRCFRHAYEQHAPGGDQIELGNILQSSHILVLAEQLCV